MNIQEIKAEYTKGMQSIISDAANKNLMVDSYAGNIRIKKSIKGVGLVLFKDSTAVRCDVDLSIATSIRTQKVMREVLGL